MKRLAAIAALLVFGNVLASAQNAAYTEESFLREMDGLRSSLQQRGDSALRALPEHWEVRSAEGEYSISSKPLKDLVLDEPSPDEDRVKLASAWVEEVERQVRSYGAQDGQAYKDPRKALTQILSRPEFEDAAPPNAWDRLVQRIRGAIYRFLQGLFEFAFQHPTESKILFWVLLSGAIVALGWWLLRMFRAPTRAPQRLNVGGARVPIRPWQDWLASAQQANARGDHKEAIRCGYWAGVMRLQESGALPVELTNTPRERLGLLQRLQHREPLAAVTNALERYWYAGQAVNGDEVLRVFQQLEAMECKAA